MKNNTSFVEVITILDLRCCDTYSEKEIFLLRRRMRETSQAGFTVKSWSDPENLIL